MRTKSLLLTAAAIAAGIVSSMAQSNVYSVNIAGYINTPVAGGNKYTLISNPLNNGINTLTNLVDASGALPAKSQVLIWNGTTYNIIGKTGTGWPSNPVIPQGTGFFIKTVAATANYTNTFVGTIPLSNSIVLPVGYTLTGGILPFSGDLTADPVINLGGILPVKSQLLVWNTATQSYIITGKTGTGWPSAVNVAAGQGYFVRVSGTSPVTWTQVVP